MVKKIIINKSFTKRDNGSCNIRYVSTKNVRVNRTAKKRMYAGTTDTHKINGTQTKSIKTLPAGAVIGEKTPQKMDRRTNK